MKNKILKATESLVEQAFRCGNGTMHVVLRAGFRCLEDACIAEKSASLLKASNALEKWLVFPASLSDRRKDELTGTSWADSVDDLEPGWDRLIGVPLIDKQINSPIAALMSFAFILRKRDYPDLDDVKVEKAVLRFSFFIARLLCWQRELQKTVENEFRRAASAIIAIHPETYQCLRPVLLL